MILPFKRLSKSAKAPSKPYADDAAYDLFADQSVEITTWGATVITTNVAVAIPKGYAGLLMGRSGLGSKGIFPVGFVLPDEKAEGVFRLGGMIDRYTGPLKVMLATVAGPCKIKQGEAIAQLWILPKVETELQDVGDGELPKTERGDKGFGSSDAKPEEVQTVSIQGSGESRLYPVYPGEDREAARKALDAYEAAIKASLGIPDYRPINASDFGAGGVFSEVERTGPGDYRFTYTPRAPEPVSVTLSEGKPVDSPSGPSEAPSGLSAAQRERIVQRVAERIKAGLDRYDEVVGPRRRPLDWEGFKIPGDDERQALANFRMLWPEYCGEPENPLSFHMVRHRDGEGWYPLPMAATPNPFTAEWGKDYREPGKINARIEAAAQEAAERLFEVRTDLKPESKGYWTHAVANSIASIFRKRLDIK